ncbi:hypothetical protein BKA62DRAFT_720713 [Auriculariales sp. MPI-PUGE-AT-0066]|nr:hypothetical protein BKA62DRAFT_720713 [Auriculariales sp. MPI-PUGE-AT-0066]
MSDPLQTAASLAQIASTTVSDWQTVESGARAIADSLRTKTAADYHTALGASALPVTLKSLLDAAATGDTATPSAQDAAAATYELLRVGANIAMDHNVNRQILLDAGVPLGVTTLLKAYSQRSPATFSIQDLKIIRTAIGLLLNGALGYEPVRTALIASRTPDTVLILTSTLARPAGWAAALADGLSPTEVDEQWKWRTGIANWATRLISEFTEHDSKGSLTTNCLPSLISVVSAFTPPYPSTAPESLAQLPSLASFIETDVETLDQASSLLEALTLDVPAFCGALATPATDAAGLRALVDFAEHGNYPPSWTSVASADKVQHEKSFGLCKAAIIKAIVATAGEDANLDVLWQDKADAAEPNGWFVERMVRWIRAHSEGKDVWDRDDLTICATLSLGNIARRDTICDSIAQPPLSITQALLPFLSPSTDLKIKHGVLGLLKNVAHAQRTRATLGDAGLIEAIAASRVWTREADFAEIVQLNAIGIVKHLCTGNLDNTLRLVVPELDETDPSSVAPASGMELILALAMRSDSVSIKSEGTRVLSTAVRALYTAEGDVASVGKRRRKAIDAVTTFDGACALASLIVRSRKYAVLLNEGVVALTLMAHHSSGASYVLHAITSSPNEANPSPSTPSGTSLTSPTSPTSASSSSAAAITITNPLDMLSFIVSNEEGVASGQAGFPPELRANVCTLLGALGKKVLPREQEDVQVGRVKAAAVQMLQGVLQEKEEVDEKAQMLRAAAQKALEAWQTPVAASQQ